MFGRPTKIETFLSQSFTLLWQSEAWIHKGFMMLSRYFSSRYCQLSQRDFLAKPSCQIHLGIWTLSWPSYSQDFLGLLIKCLCSCGTSNLCLCWPFLSLALWRITSSGYSAGIVSIDEKMFFSLRMKFFFLPKVPHPAYLNRVVHIEAFNTISAGLLSKHLQLFCPDRALCLYLEKGLIQFIRKMYFSSFSLLNPGVNDFQSFNRESLIGLWTLSTGCIVMSI